MSIINKSPGVYVSEQAAVPLQVEQAPTGIPVFIGYTLYALNGGKPIPSTLIGGRRITKPFRITGLQEFSEHFGADETAPFGLQIEELFDQDSVSLKTSIHTEHGIPFGLYHHLRLFFANGGEVCYIIRVGSSKQVRPSKSHFLAGLRMAETSSDYDLLLFPEVNYLASFADAAEVYQTAMLQASTLKDRFAILDCYADDPALMQSADGLFTGSQSFAAVYHPQLKSPVTFMNDAESLSKLKIRYKKLKLNSRGQAVVIGRPSWPKFTDLNLSLQSLVLQELKKLEITLPPSAAVAGCYSRTDSNVGVWKAPANVALQMVNRLSKNISQAESEKLNNPPSGRSVNAIREFAGKGILIWGARTLDGHSNDWKYIPVRRAINMVEESLSRALQSFLFEPNNANTWTIIRSVFSDFLFKLWKEGALVGIKPEEAYFISIGLGHTMTSQDILNGYLRVSVLLALIRPAEFFIITMELKMMSN